MQDPPHRPLRATFTAAIVGAYLIIGGLTVIGFLLSVRSLDLVFASRFAQTGSSRASSGRSHLPRSSQTIPSSCSGRGRKMTRA